MCPTEVEKYVGLGSAVLISSVLAAVSGTVAFATAAGGGDDLAMWLGICLPLGVVYGAIVFAIDRFLVSSSLNPITITRLDSDGGGGDDTGAGQAARLARRGGEVARTLAAATPRLVLAGLIGLLVAEPVLLVVFRREINQQVAEIQAAQADQAADRIDTRYDDELDRISTREAELDLIDAPVTEARDDLAELDDQIEVIETDLAELQLLLRSEIAGVVVGETGEQTTGQTGDGPVADELRAEIELQQARLDGLTTRRESQQLRVNDLGTGQADRNDGATAELVALASERQELAQQRQFDLTEVATRTEGADGLLMRIEALEWLTRNELDPNELGPNGLDPNGAAGVVGGLTTVGIAVWLVRLWVLLLDAIPIGFKVLLSLRSQRPYDTVLAVHQAAEMDVARSLLAGELVAVGNDEPAVTGQVPAVRLTGATNGATGNGRPSGARYLSPSTGSLGRFTPNPAAAERDS
jgi:hypothetical protein